MTIEPATVVLCDDAAHAGRAARSLAESGAHVVDTADLFRATVADQIGRRVDRDEVHRAIAALHLPDDVLNWRPRELPALQRMLAASLVAIVHGRDPLLFDVTVPAASPFDVAHTFGHLRRLRAVFPRHVIALIADPALLSSAGDHLVVLHDDAIVEEGPLSQCLAHPRSDYLIGRLASTPIASPLAMQLRRVQRASTFEVNYAHTEIITLPTRDSIALAGGDE